MSVRPPELTTLANEVSREVVGENQLSNYRLWRSIYAYAYFALFAQLSFVGTTVELTASAQRLRSLVKDDVLADALITEIDALAVEKIRTNTN